MHTKLKSVANISHNRALTLQKRRTYSWDGAKGVHQGLDRLNWIVRLGKEGDNERVQVPRKHGINLPISANELTSPI